MLFISESKSKLNDLKSILETEFEMKDLKSARKILGMKINKNRSKCMLNIYQFHTLTSLNEKRH